MEPVASAVWESPHASAPTKGGRRHSSGANPPVPRPATDDDLSELLRLETDCFEDWRQDSRQVIRNSLHHPRREVWVLPDGAGPVLLAALYLRWNAKTLRLYSIATSPAAQGRGCGTCLMHWTFARAAALGLTTITLEADARRPALLRWYEGFGFTRAKSLKGFYGPGRHAWRMRLSLSH